MKKVLAFLLTVVLVVSAGVCVAFAAPSAEAQGIISGITATDAAKEDVAITVEKIDGKVNNAFEEELEDLKKDEKDDTLKVVGHYELVVDGDPEYPVSVTLDVLGIDDGSKVFVMVEKDGSVTTIATEVVDGQITFELDGPADKIAIVTDGDTAADIEGNEVVAPQTGDISVYVAFAGVIALAVLVLVSKKVKA